MSVRARHLTEGWPSQPGEFVYETRRDYEGATGLIFACPCGCGDVSGITFDLVPEWRPGEPRWHWNGDEDAPTLSPSLHKTEGCRWHGWLRAGEFVPC